MIENEEAEARKQPNREAAPRGGKEEVAVQLTRRF